MAVETHLRNVEHGTSTSRRRILNREGNECNYDYIHDQRAKEQRDKEKK